MGGEIYAEGWRKHTGRQDIGASHSSGVEIGRPFGLRAAAPKQRGIRTPKRKAPCWRRGGREGKGLTRCEPDAQKGGSVKALARFHSTAAANNFIAITALII